MWKAYSQTKRRQVTNHPAKDIKTNKMKTYRRIEVVKAEPMSELDAIKKNYRFRIAGDDSDWEEGYHTKEFTLGGRIYMAGSMIIKHHFL
jgi:hypothetical protein